MSYRIELKEVEQVNHLLSLICGLRAQVRGDISRGIRVITIIHDTTQVELDLGNESLTTTFFDQDGDVVQVSEAEPLPNNVWYTDADGDGYNRDIISIAFHLSSIVGWGYGCTLLCKLGIFRWDWGCHDWDNRFI